MKEKREDKKEKEEKKIYRKPELNREGKLTDVVGQQIIYSD